MHNKNEYKVVLLGAGNVATHLGKALTSAGIPVIQVFSRSNASASRLGNLMGCAYTSSEDKLDVGGDIYVMAVSDDAIPVLAARLPLRDKLVVHTSGSTPMEVLRPASNNIGVLYPLQTFSAHVDVDFSSIPMCVEAATVADLDMIKTICARISRQVIEVSSHQRMHLHLAAVFACNFVNHLYAAAGDILNQHHLSFNLLRPLIAETARKVMETSPHLAQTGPARRNNAKILDLHESLLASHPRRRALYKLISQSIAEEYKHNL